ncbi:hypothetical protein A7E75_01675 [Syntrophotalea acetylenica]|jgi:hypothetical protein|uniref:Uncharacterized protein n=1 Tax=Syntrophotalea acetylenica TaxID=29542 RepID=A0A1L3GD60_SYNAC|nr:hypothetical protein A7E75_01675 [Syntrophotalea acetylenica]APG44457.1 hypothetical protein A6070_10290 [Syntrophotalea acetylenica]
MDRSQRKVKAETLRNEKEDLANPAKKNPGLVNEIDAIQIGEKLSHNFPGKADRQRFMDRVCERVAGNYLNGRKPDVIKVREGRSIGHSVQGKEVRE